MSAQSLQKLAKTAIEAATKAGRFIAATRPRNVRQDKEGDSLAVRTLTEVDGQSQEMILKILAPTLAEYDLALLAEESADDQRRLEKDHFWCVDPIDGTLPYVEGVPGYAVSIALVAKNGEPLIGVVFDPVERTLYHAVKGHGAYRNEQPWKLPAPDGDIRIFTDRSVAAQTSAALGATVERCGGAVMNAIWCLENPPACYFKFPKAARGGGSLWDYAATAAIFNEIGAAATDMSGNPLDLNRADSTYMNHRGICYATDADLAKQLFNLKEIPA